MPYQHPTARLHILFLNGQDGMGADIAVHISIARALDRSRVRVSAATTSQTTPSGGASARAAFEAIPELTLLPLNLGRTIGQQRGLARLIAMLDNLRGGASLISLAGWCRKNGVDVVHVTERPRQALFGLLLARMAGCACLIHAHTSHQSHDDTPLANWRLRQADAVVGVSNFTADTFRIVGRLPANRVFAVYNAVDGHFFRPATDDTGRRTMRIRLGIPDGVPVVGCVARLTRWKGQAMLLEALGPIRQSLPGTRLVLVGKSDDTSPDGNGDYSDYLLRRVAALGLSEAVILPGFIHAQDMPQLYAAIDVLAHPAIEEPFGLAVVEAMACSRPVVAIANGGVPEIIRDSVDGLLVPRDQPPRMSAAVTRVLSEPKLADRLARAGRERVLHSFTPEIQAEAMLNVYRQIAPQHTRYQRERAAIAASSR